MVICGCRFSDRAADIKAGFGAAAANHRWPVTPSGSTGHEVINIRGTGHCDGDAVFTNFDFASGDRMVIGQDPDFVMFRGVERNHRPAAHPQQLVLRFR